jgi:DNA-binding NarL/FixJ family response regulator
MIKVLVADEHAVVREGLKEILSKIHDVQVIDTTKDEQELIEKTKKKNIDVILLDASITEKSGMRIIKYLQLKKPGTPIIIFNMFIEDHDTALVLRSGAAGYLSKECEPKELIHAIREVSHGNRYINPAVAQKIAFDLTSSDEKPSPDLLSDREHEVLLHIARGKTQKEIAAELDLSIKTISYYRSRILIKMKMKNNADVIRYALKNHLVD